MWQLSGSPRIYLDVFPITSWHRHLACHCLGTGETSWIQRGGHEAVSRSWDNIIDPETESLFIICLPARSRRWNIMAVAPETSGQWVNSAVSGDQWSQWAPCLTGLACSSRLGPGHLRFYCIPILLISKLPTPMKFGISLQLKASGQKHILSVLC